MFEGRQLECSAKYQVRVLVGTRPDENIEPYPLALFLLSAPYGEADRAMTQFAASGYKNLSWVLDANLVM
jgi:hypothetical protein